MTKSEKVTNKKIIKAFITYAKRNNIKSFCNNEDLKNISLELEKIQEVDGLNKTFCKMLFSEQDQNILKDYTKIITKVAEFSESTTKYINAIKKLDVVIENLEKINGNTFCDSVWKTFRHVQIKNTNTDTNKGNLNMTYTLLVKACYLLKFRNIQMKYKTIDEIEKEKATAQQQEKENKKADALIAKALKAMSEKDKAEFLAKFAN